MNARLTFAIAFSTLASLVFGFAAPAQIHTIEFAQSKTRKVTTRLKTNPQMVTIGSETWQLSRNSVATVWQQPKDAMAQFEFAGTPVELDTHAVYSIAAFDNLIWALRDDGAVVQFAGMHKSSRIRGLEGTKELVPFGDKLWALRFDGSVATVDRGGLITEMSNLGMARQMVKFEKRLFVLQRDGKTQTIDEFGTMDQSLELWGADVLAFDAIGLHAISEQTIVGSIRGTVSKTTLRMIEDDGRQMKVGELK